MIFATLDDFGEIIDIFKYYKEIFPHIRNDFIKRMIENGNCIFQDGVVITFNKYKRVQKIGEKTKAEKGDWILHQIATKNQGKGVARKVLKDFFDFVDGDLWLTVRADNIIARKFYEKMGMIEIDNKTWKSGTLKGKVYKKLK